MLENHDRQTLAKRYDLLLEAERWLGLEGDFLAQAEIARRRASTWEALHGLDERAGRSPFSDSESEGIDDDARVEGEE